MSEYTANSVSNCAHPRATVAGLRPGAINRDQLIFIVICSLAVSVAVVAMVLFFTGGPKVRAAKWQCLQGGHEFRSATSDYPPIDCPKGDGEAVELLYEKCRQCKEKTLVARIRLTAQALAQRDTAWKQAEEAGKPHKPTKDGHSLGRSAPPMDAQYWIKQADGSFAWSPWVEISSPQAAQLRAVLQCTHCGAGIQ